MTVLLREQPRLRGELTIATFDSDLTDTDAALALIRESEVESLAAAQIRRWVELRQRRVGQARDHNLITNVGRSDVASRVVGGATTVPSYIAVGNVVIAPAATDVVLAGEIFRKACSTVAVLSTYYARWVVNFTTGDFNDTVRGFGLFTAAAAGSMHAIASGNVLKDATLSLVAEWRWLVSAS